MKSIQLSIEELSNDINGLVEIISELNKMGLSEDCGNEIVDLIYESLDEMTKVVGLLASIRK